jgi:antitoxin MazE
MKTRVQKWGNSLAVRIPAAMAHELSICDGTAVEVRLVDGELRLSPAGLPELDIDDLIAAITQENKHEAIDFGPPVGNETL